MIGLELGLYGWQRTALGTTVRREQSDSTPICTEGTNPQMSRPPSRRAWLQYRIVSTSLRHRIVSSDWFTVRSGRHPRTRSTKARDADAVAVAVWCTRKMVNFALLRRMLDVGCWTFAVDWTLQLDVDRRSVVSCQCQLTSSWQAAPAKRATIRARLRDLTLCACTCDRKPRDESCQCVLGSMHCIASR